jgi:hypothetical protein
MVGKFSKNLGAAFKLYLPEMWRVIATPKSSKYYILPQKNLVAWQAEFTSRCLTLYYSCSATWQLRWEYN